MSMLGAAEEYWGQLKKWTLKWTPKQVMGKDVTISCCHRCGNCSPVDWGKRYLVNNLSCLVHLHVAIPAETTEHPRNAS